MGNPAPWETRPRCPLCGRPMRRLDSGRFYCTGAGCSVEFVKIVKKEDLAWRKTVPAVHAVGGVGSVGDGAPP
ncbi:MAG: hypothetical protein Q8O47_09290 [Candidatus Bathyarchaeota archaeon]|nr:hypothetical protein [Candidatus Bathyarchaeota archaeon]